jgi:glucose-1-phosphate thymidylyltransferase
MIYYPISTLMLAGTTEILIITTPEDQKIYKELLGNGSNFGIHFSYAVQPKPEGIAQALIIAEDFLDGESCLMILGDNIFHGVGLGGQLTNTFQDSGAHIFSYAVANPQEYGVVELNSYGEVVGLIEKPEFPRSNLAITGLYFFDNKASALAREITPSPRGELEITSLLEMYRAKNELNVTQLKRGTAWLDTGTPKGLHDAATYIRIIEERTGLKISCPEEIAFEKHYISIEQLHDICKALKDNDYSRYLRRILNPQS